MKEIKLDIWDFQLIRTIKLELDSLTKCREIWAAKFDLKTVDVDIRIINNYLCKLALEMNLIDIHFIFDLNPANSWKFPQREAWDEFLFYRLASLFRILKVSSIPGYKEHFNL